MFDYGLIYRVFGALVFGLFLESTVIGGFYLTHIAGNLIYKDIHSTSFYVSYMRMFHYSKGDQTSLR